MTVRCGVEMLNWMAISMARCIVRVRMLLGILRLHVLTQHFDCAHEFEVEIDAAV